MKTKLKVIVLLCIVFCTIMGATSYAKEEVIRVGYNEEYQYIQQTLYGNEEGIWANYFRKLANVSNLKFEFVPCKEYEIQEKLDAGEIDIYGPVEKQATYEQEYVYSSKRYGMDKVVITAPTFNSIYYDDIEVIGESRLLIQCEKLVRDELDEYLSYNGLKPVRHNLSQKDITKHNFKYQREDLFVTTALQMNENNKVVAELGSMELYFITDQKHYDKLERVTEEVTHNKTLGILSFDAMYYEEEQDFDYAKQLLTEADIQLLNKKDTYTVGYLGDNEPISYYDEERKLRGVGIDMMNKIAYDGRFKVKYVDILNDPYRDVDFYLGIPTQLGGKFDARVTIPYLVSPYMIVGKEKQYDSSLRVGYLSYEGITEEYLTNCFANVKLSNCSTIEQLTGKIKENKIDYAVVTSLLATSIKDSMPYDNIIVEPIGDNKNFRIAVSDSLTSKYIFVLNKLINRMGKESEIETLMDSQLQYNKWPVFQGFVREHITHIRIILVMLLLMLSSFSFLKGYKQKHGVMKMVNVDDVTGCFTEKYFVEMCEKKLKKGKGEYEIISIDIDNFKHVNDMISYERGTELLVEFANILKGTLVHKELIARVFADKFLILVNREDYAEEWDRFDIKEVSKEKMISLNQKYNMCLYVSVGVYKIPKDLRDIHIRSMINAANAARTAGKNIYGNTLTIYNELMEEKIVSTNNIIKYMETAITEKEFKAYYQPKMNLKTGEIAGAEALVRWVRKDGNTIFPDQFIPIFEKNSFIITLDYYMFETVCEFLRKNREKNIPVISVNLSSVTLLEPKVVQRLVTTTQVYEIPTNRIEIEVTESAFIEYEQIKDVIDEFKRQGFIISMDDFGSGVSSLGRLKELPVDILKIDKQFLNNITNNTKGYLIMKHIIGMAQELESETISEGVETIEQARLLKEMGCDLVQGYFFSRPISEENFLKFVENYKLITL